LSSARSQEISLRESIISKKRVDAFLTKGSRRLISVTFSLRNGHKFTASFSSFMGKRKKRPNFLAEGVMFFSLKSCHHTVYGFFRHVVSQFNEGGFPGCWNQVYVIFQFIVHVPDDAF